ncbi:hypothetical protein F3Y22_tig00111105pilonHSYRG00383 [Hibiscus syriacus]|uniref:Uncharacterized protein n=1 Tax=Hibiscus syriacus TaxID=106335 RepID=A0A6A2YYU3_HIBSY|nr:hypothetical protein F3Y22_tig00111105pilonHSYRG00383 [Hibiscus syriacus]
MDSYSMVRLSANHQFLALMQIQLLYKDIKFPFVNVDECVKLLPTVWFRWELDDSTNAESYNGWGPTDAPKHSELGNTGWIDELIRKDYNGWGVQDSWPTWVNNIFLIESERT